MAIAERLSLRRPGFYVDSCGYLGASPDGVVVHSDGRVESLVEVKCPFSAQNMTIQQACEIKSFCCSIDNYLKLDHDYYYQVQGQVETDETESWNGNRKRKAGTES